MSPGWRRSSSPAPLAHRKRLRGLTNISTQERESPCHAARCHVQKNLLTSGASYKSGPGKVQQAAWKRVLREAAVTPISNMVGYLAALLGESPMEEQQIGWIAAIIIGGIAGWLAEQFMKSQMGFLMNIVLGIVGAAVASWLFSLLGITFGGWIGYLIAGFIGACILIAIARAFSGGLQQRT